MGDDITTGELGRRLDAIQQMLASVRAEVVGRPEYSADLRGIDRQFREVAADVEDVRRQHAEDVKALHERITRQAEAGADHRMHWRTLLYTGLIPSLVAVIAIIVNTIVSHGGHLCGHGCTTRRPPRSRARSSSQRSPSLPCSRTAAPCPRPGRLPRRRGARHP